MLTQPTSSSPATAASKIRSGFRLSPTSDCWNGVKAAERVAFSFAERVAVMVCCSALISALAWRHGQRLASTGQSEVVEVAHNFLQLVLVEGHGQRALQPASDDARSSLREVCDRGRWNDGGMTPITV